MNPSVLILSNDAEFARALLGRWQCERNLPAFTVLSAKGWKPPAERQASVIAIVGGTFDACQSVIAALEEARIPAIFVATTAKDAKAAAQKVQRTAVLKKSDDWLDAVVLLATEMLRRVLVAEHAAEAEARAKEAERFAVLGKYMLEMRHTLNNALTSVVGNAELLLMEPGTLQGEAREQVDTIHKMSLRMHEVIQRFSSIEAEMRFAETDSQSETAAAWRSAASGK
jgi:signal transduction histidine kinase